MFVMFRYVDVCVT